MAKLLCTRKPQCLVWIAAGSRFESAATSGTAHFLEHMLFKGTNRRSVWRLEEDFETVGGHLNAYTSREQTFYYAKVMKKHVPFALDVLADILQNPLFDARRIDIEHDAILREIQELKACYLLHLDGTTQIVEDMGRQMQLMWKQ